MNVNAKDEKRSFVCTFWLKRKFEIKIARPSADFDCVTVDSRWSEKKTGFVGVLFVGGG